MMMNKYIELGRGLSSKTSPHDILKVIYKQLNTFIRNKLFCGYEEDVGNAEYLSEYLFNMYDNDDLSNVTMQVKIVDPRSLIFQYIERYGHYVKCVNYDWEFVSLMIKDDLTEIKKMLSKLKMATPVKKHKVWRKKVVI